MARVVVIFLVLLESLVASQSFSRCVQCHQKDAPPLFRIYRRYLLLYSSKKRIERKMVEFLTFPSLDKSVMPLGMRKRFNPATHPAFGVDIAKRAVQELIEKEDIVKRIIVPK